MRKEPDAGGLAALTFATDALPQADRLPVWREILGRAALRLEIEPVAGDPFRAEATLHALPGVTLGTIYASPVRVQRTPELIQDGQTDISLIVPTSAPVMVTQNGREAILAPGDAVFLRNAEAGSVRSASTNGWLNICIPEAVLTPAVMDVGMLSMTIVPAGDETLRLLLNYVALLKAEHARTSPLTARLAARHIHDLAVSILGARRDVAEHAGRRGIGAARLCAIKADISRNICRHDLSIGMIAARHKLSTRYVRKLFGAEEGSFSAFVLDARLERAFQLLRNPGHAGQTIAAIAFGSGFGDLSYFNRTFRRHYGATPSDIREQSRAASAYGFTPPG